MFRTLNCISSIFTYSLLECIQNLIITSPPSKLRAVVNATKNHVRDSQVSRLMRFMGTPVQPSPRQRPLAQPAAINEKRSGVLLAVNDAREMFAH